MKKTVVIADDNLDCSKSIGKVFSSPKSNFDVLGIANSGKKTIYLINKYNPNFLILDLNMPNQNGLEVLEELEKNENCKTRIIIISAEIPMINHLNLVHYKKICNVFIKPFKLSMLYSVIDNIDLNTDEDIENIIDSILHKFNFNYSSQFYKYLLTATRKSLYGPFILNKIYEEIAREQNINLNKVKWGIEKLIISMIRYTPTSTLSKYFPYTKKPSPKVFIYEISTIVKNQIIENNK